LIHVAIRSTMK